MACSSQVHKESAYRTLVGKPEGKISLEDLDVGRMIVLTQIFDKLDAVV
jgi:hypothetical protein